MMKNDFVNLMKAYLKDLPADVAKEVFAKLGTVKCVEDVVAIKDEYKLSLSNEACSNIFSAISVQKDKALSDEDLELVSGGCTDSGC